MVSKTINLKDTFKLAEIIRRQNYDYWDKDKRKTAFENLNKDLSDFFGVDKPKISFLEKNKTILGLLDKKNKTIYMSKYSLIIFLHEFFHYVYNSSEIDTRIFSVIVFFLSYPEKIQNLKLVNGCVFKI